MPPLNDYKCTKCGFELRKGWGYHFYVEDDNGERILCPHPAEKQFVREVLGVTELVPAVVERRTGFNSHCICLDCLHQFNADLGEGGFSPYESLENILKSIKEDKPRRRQQKDKRECPECRSKNVKTELEMVGQPCPMCKEGVIEEIWTGAIS